MQQSAPEGYPSTGGRQNPLQTMQDMVEQTNNMQNAGYGTVKSEGSVHIQNGMMQSAQMAAMRGGVSSSISSGPIMSHNDPIQTGYHMSQMQRQQSYPGAHIDSSIGRQNRPDVNTLM